MSLENEINKMRKEIRTDGYPMSIGEWISLYQNNELDIHPEFQRIYRWTLTQKSNFIESILLGIPIPPIFVSQRQNGIWDVVDGLQRLSTLFEFMGILKDENGETLPPLKLCQTKYLPSLGNKYWNNPSETDESLNQEQRLLIKRSKLSVSIILRESDELAKYELFQRLNTGGTNLEPQEMRNCILVMLNKKFYEWLRDISKYPAFVECIALSEKNIEEQYDMELALRFIVFSQINLSKYNRLGDVGEFITDRMIEFAMDEEFKRMIFETAFKRAFDLLAQTLNENSFKRYDREKSKFVGGFLLSPFEVIAFGIGYNYNSLPPAEKIEDLIKSIWTHPTFVESSGSGVRASTRLPKLIPLGREVFKA